MFKQITAMLIILLTIYISLFITNNIYSQDLNTEQNSYNNIMKIINDSKNIKKLEIDNFINDNPSYNQKDRKLTFEFIFGYIEDDGYLLTYKSYKEINNKIKTLFENYTLTLKGLNKEKLNVLKLEKNIILDTEKIKLLNSNITKQTEQYKLIKLNYEKTIIELKSQNLKNNLIIGGIAGLAGIIGTSLIFIFIIK